MQLKNAVRIAISILALLAGSPAPAIGDVRSISISPGQLSLQINQSVQGSGLKFILQTDCNLVLYGADKSALWASNTSRLASHCFATYQTDGNLVVYDTDTKQAIYSTHAQNSTALLLTSQSPYLTFTASNIPVVLTCPMPFTGLHIQQCVDSAPVGARIELLPATSPNTTYYLDRPIRVLKSLTLTTRGQFPVDNSAEAPPCGNLNGNMNSVTPDYNRCANLQAINGLSYNDSLNPPLGSGSLPAPGFNGGLLVIDGRQANNLSATISGVLIDHLIVSGNSGGRDPHSACTGDNSVLCANIIVANCDHCTIRHSVSQWAPGHLGSDGGGTTYANIVRNSDAFVLYGNTFYHAGTLAYDPTSPTYLRSTGGASNNFEFGSEGRNLAGIVIAWNNFFDGTDGNLVIAARTGTQVTGEVANNQIYQFSNMMSGTMFGMYAEIWNANQFTASFGEGSKPASALWVHDNAIDCDFSRIGRRQCPFGISLGVQPWGDAQFASTTLEAYKVAGGRIENNQVENARIAINIDGVSRNGWANMYVINNRMANSCGIKINKAAETNRSGVSNNRPNSLHTNCTIDSQGIQAGAELWNSTNALPVCGQEQSKWSQIDTSIHGCVFGMTACVSSGMPAP